MSKSKKERVAEAKYNRILHKIVIPLVGNKTTFQNQLHRAGKKLLGVKFKGVYPSDKIPRLNDLAPYCILNLDKSNEPGSHWIALAKYRDGCIVYDSFARKASRIIPQLNFSGNGKAYSDTKDSEQDITETNCGARSLAFLAFIETHGEKDALLI